VAAERIQAIEQQAHAEGFARGQQDAEAELERRVDATVQQLAATIAELDRLRPSIMQRADRELINLAIAMAERIIRREVKCEPEVLLIMARVAIERLGERAAAVVHLHPADHEAVMQAVPGRVGSLQLVADPAVARGGCLIRSEAGLIDAGIDAQIRELSRALLDRDPSEEATDGPVAGR
jgi:flagellar assembly protein FliH